MCKRNGILAALVMLFVMLTPALVLADDDLGRWNPAGVYISASTGNPLLGDTVFLLTVIPADNQGHHFIGIQDRVAEHDAETQSMHAIEFWRTGRNTFDFELIMYSRERDAEGNIVIQNNWFVRGVFARNDSGEVWVQDQQAWFAPACQSILDPALGCTVIGPIPVDDGQFQSQLGHGGPALGL